MLNQWNIIRYLKEMRQTTWAMVHHNLSPQMLQDHQHLINCQIFGFDIDALLENLEQIKDKSDSDDARKNLISCLTEFGFIGKDINLMKAVESRLLQISSTFMRMDPSLKIPIHNAVMQCILIRHNCLTEMLINDFHKGLPIHLKNEWFLPALQIYSPTVVSPFGLIQLPNISGFDKPNLKRRWSEDSNST